ncbi:hypothetical protein FQN50_001091 [Emmonsiellopsis sp. PD_5]|nr:hypothetical protein FQN50_001091 [Emmonsiellopsis sp. PD_5]
MSQTNGIPFYRKQDDIQVTETLQWIEDFPVAFPEKLLSVIYPADFDSDGKIRSARESWNKDDGVKHLNAPPFITMQPVLTTMDEKQMSPAFVARKALDRFDVVLCPLACGLCVLHLELAGRVLQAFVSATPGVGLTERTLPTLSL